jgi:ribosomal protein S18 acetylase RimI-like enzyme
MTSLGRVGCKCVGGGPGSIVAVVGVGLRRMREDEFADWLPLAREDYADDMVRNGGADPEAARAKAMRDSERLFPGGLPSAEQLVFVIEADGERVGELWLSAHDSELRRVLFVWNIRLDEQHRGRGFGKQAMLLAEAEARRRGLAHIELNVMGGNETARRLYRSLGYTETFVSMEKPVEPE